MEDAKALSVAQQSDSRSGSSTERPLVQEHNEWENHRRQDKLGYRKSQRTAYRKYG